MHGHGSTPPALPVVGLVPAGAAPPPLALTSPATGALAGPPQPLGLPEAPPAPPALQDLGSVSGGPLRQGLRPPRARLWTWCRFVVSLAGAGALPFGAVFVEAYFVQAALWLGALYHDHVYMLAALLLALVQAGLVGVLYTAAALRRGGVRWWWSSVVVPGASCGLWGAGYAVHYGMTKLAFADGVSYVVYGITLLLLCGLWAVMMGCAGFVGAYAYLRWLFRGAVPGRAQ
jgi:hypothetical protein